MRSFLLSALLVGIVSAQSLAGLPICAYSCVTSSIPASCNLNPKCICEASTFIAGVTCCVTKVCSEADQLATLKYAKSICTPAGVTLTQTAAVCASTGNSTMKSTSTSMMSSMASSAMASTSSLSASMSSSLSSVMSSASSAASSVASSASAAATSAAGAGRMVLQRGGEVFAAVVAAAAIL